MRLKIVQAGERVLRQRARDLTTGEIRGETVRQLIEMMRETMRDAPGVGLAAPQAGLGIRMAVIEDREQYQKILTPQQLSERGRRPVPFHVIINPEITLLEPENADVFFEGCLSVSGLTALVSRARKVVVDCLNEHAEPVHIEAEGWYARILQHEIDHLEGTLYVDRMEPRSLMTTDNYSRFWKDMSLQQVRAELRL
jgi:peptide deformylase